MKSRNSSTRSVAAAMVLALALSGCSTLESAYQNTKDTVSGWFKSDSEKDQKK